MNSNRDWPITFIMHGHLPPDFWTAYQTEWDGEEAVPNREAVSQASTLPPRHAFVSTFIACIFLMLSGLMLATHNRQLVSVPSSQTQGWFIEVGVPTR